MRLNLCVLLEIYESETQDAQVDGSLQLLLELVFVLSKIIKVLVRVISVSLRLRLLTLTPI